MIAPTDRDGGTVTVEAAMGIGAVVAVFGFTLAGLALVIGQLRCVDAAVEAARLVSRGEPERAVEVVAQLAPPDAELEVNTRNGLVTTTVTSPSPGGFLPHTLKSHAKAIPEPGISTEALP